MNNLSSTSNNGMFGTDIKWLQGIIFDLQELSNTLLLFYYKLFESVGRKCLSICKFFGPAIKSCKISKYIKRACLYSAVETKVHTCPSPDIKGRMVNPQSTGI